MLIVPLSKKSLEILKQLEPLTGHSEYIFPGRVTPKKCMSNNTMLYAMYRMGYHSRATPHGFRGLASTVLHEHGFNSDHIELQLSHAERNKVKASYNFAMHLPERHKMMAWWSEYIEQAASRGDNVVEGRFGSNER